MSYFDQLFAQAEANDKKKATGAAASVASPQTAGSFAQFMKQAEANDAAYDRQEQSALAAEASHQKQKALKTERADEQDKLLVPSASRQQAARTHALATERADELDKMLVPSASRQAAQAAQEEPRLGRGGGNKHQTLPMRIEDAISGALKKYASTGLNNFEVSYAAGQNARDELNNYYAEDARRTLEQARRDYQQMVEDGARERDLRDQQALIADYERRLAAYESAGNIQRGATEETAKIVDSISESGDRDISRAKEGLGKAGQFGIDAAVAISQMGADAALGGVTGVGAMVPMLVRSFGGGAQEARNKGYSTEQQLALGLTNAATEWFTEKLFGGNPVYDKAGKVVNGEQIGLVNKAINAAVTKFAGSAKAQQLMKILASPVAETLNEGWEEVASDLLDPMFELIITGTKDERTLSEKLQQYAESWLLGVALGVVGQAGDRASTAMRGADVEAAQQTEEPRYLKTAEQMIAEREAQNAGKATQATTAEGSLTPQTTEGVETQKTVSGETAKTAINTNPRLHTAEEQSIIEAYKNAVDYDLLSWIKKVRAALDSGDKTATKMRHPFGAVAERTQEAVRKATGIDTTGFEHMIDGSAASHDNIRHGENGKADSSMENPEDLARIKYVLDNFDTCELLRTKNGAPMVSHQFRDKNNRPAPKVFFTKKVDGTYYVVEAVADSADKKLHVISAYMDGKKPSGDIIQVPSVDSSPRRTPEASLGPVVSALNNATIAQQSNVVKSGSEYDAMRLKTAEELYGAEPGKQSYGRSFDELAADIRPLPTAEELAAQQTQRPEPEAPRPLPTAEELAAQQTEPQLTRETVPAKAQPHLKRAENSLLRRLKDSLGVERFLNRAELTQAAQELSSEYLRDGKVSKETVDLLFEQAYEQGIVEDRELYDQYKDLKKLIRDTSISISEEDSHDIADFPDFRKTAFGTLRIAKSGTPVDIVYEEFRAKAPELFPASITHPAEQLQRIYDVGKMIRRVETSLSETYEGQNEDFKRWARNDFETAVNDSVAELNRVRRYAQERAAKQTAPEITEQSVASAFHNIRNARRTMERAKSQNLLTDYDNGQVGRLLRGEITLEDLDPKKTNVKGVREVYEASREYERYAETIRDYNKQRKANLLEEADGLLETANGWKDKPAGILYSRETMERNVRDIVPDRKTADAINAKYFAPVHEAEAASARFKNEYRDRVRNLDLSRKVEKGNVVSEAHAVQLLGEATDNLRVLNEKGEAGAMRDGKTAQEWEAAIRELWEQNPNLDRKKIESAVQEFRTIYDELFQRMNEVRVRNGYEPIGYRQGYFPHFQPGDADGVMASFAKALGLDVNVSALPTSINGLTHTFKPGISWFGNAQERLGFNTAYDAVEGFDKYIEGVSDVVHQTDNIQRLRALATQIRYRTTDDGMREQMDAINENPNLSDEEKRANLDELYQNGRFTLGNFVVELEEYTNLLANKKSRADRNMEQAMGRRMYTAMKNLESRVAANMVAINPGSWLTNFIPLTQAWATVDSKHLLKGMAQTLNAYRNDDGMVERSNFLTNRRGSDPLVKTWAQNVSSKMSSPMEYIDQFTADTLVRSRYAQNIDNGMSEENAIREADAWAAGIMADRSKGSMPTIFNRSNPLTKLFTQFQLEVNNEFSNIFKDVPDELKKKGLGALAAGLLKYFVGAWLYNEVYEYFVGRRAAFDPIDLLNDTVGDMTGYQLPNTIEGVKNLSQGKPYGFETQKAGNYGTLENFAKNAAEELPFIGGVLGGGRVPISSALPNVENLAKAAVNDQWDDRKRLATAGKELLAPATYLLPPFGGGQIKKIYQGIKAISEGGSYSVDSQGRDILQYPVFSDTAGETAENTARALLFGKSSLPEAREWVESGFDSMGAKQTAVYQGMNAAGVSGRDAYGLLRELESVQKTDEESASTIKRHILQDSDISGEGKSIAYYGLLASDKEREIMDSMPDDADMGTVTDTMMRLKDADNLADAEAKSKAKYQAILDADLPTLEKRILYRELVSDSHEEDIDKLFIADVPFDQYLSFERDSAGVTGTKGADGKDVKGQTKRDKLLGLIDGYDLTDEQKDAMYFAAGYAESTLKNAPWRSGEGAAQSMQGINPDFAAFLRERGQPTQETQGLNPDFAAFLQKRQAEPRYLRKA